MSYTQVPPNSTGNRIDTQVFADLDGNAVHRQVVAPSDGLKGTAGRVSAANNKSLQYAAITDGGSGYVVDEVITLTGGTIYTAAQVRVLAVDGSGTITAVTVERIGAYSTSPASMTQGSTTGAGTGAAFTTTMGTNIGVMVDTTGFHGFEFQFYSFTSGVVSVEASLDGGITWGAITWYRGNAQENGTTGSCGNGVVNRVQAPSSLIRVVCAHDGAFAWALRSANFVPVTVIQGANTGSNNIWLMAAYRSNFGAAGHTSGSGGCVPIISAATTNATLIVSSSRRIHLMQFSNSGAAWAYLKVFAKNSTPVPGTDTPVAVFGIPPGETISIVDGVGGFQITSALGIGIAITGAPGLLDTTAIAANEVVGTIVYN